MSVTIPGVPERFTREQYLSIFEAVGITPRDTMSLHLDYTGVHAVVIARDEDGNKIISGDGAATHTIFIPVEPEPKETHE